MNTTLKPPRAVPAIDRQQAATLATTENERFVALVQSLAPADWTAPTDCPAWDVRAMVSHVLGAMEGHISPRVFVHQALAGKRAAGDRPDVDGMTEVQVRERLHLGPDELVAAVTTVAPAAARARARVPSLLRRVTFKVDVGGVKEPWTLAYLFEVVLTRDVWMHRVDIARATHRPLELTPEHDGVLVADVVAEWARRHGQAYRLHLDGPAGGRFASGAGGEEISMDAVEFCRVLSGRGTATGLLSQPVPF